MGSTVCRAIVGHTSVCSLAYKLSGLIHSQPWPVLHTAGDKQTGGEGVLCGPSPRHVLSSPSLHLGSHPSFSGTTAFVLKVLHK